MDNYLYYKKEILKLLTAKPTSFYGHLRSFTDFLEYKDSYNIRFHYHNTDESRFSWTRKQIADKIIKEDINIFDIISFNTSTGEVFSIVDYLLVKCKVDIDILDYIQNSDDKTNWWPERIVRLTELNKKASEDLKLWAKLQ